MKSILVSSKPALHLPKLLVLSLGFVLTGMFQQSAHAASQTWDGGPGGTGTDFGLAANWTNNTLPTTNDTGAFNGTATGNLSLSYTGGFSASGSGLIISLASAQINSVTIDSGVSTTALRIGGVTIASSAGAFTLGDGSDIFNVTLGNAGGSTQTFTNDSTNTATLKSDVVFTQGGSGNHTLAIGGSGNWAFQNVINSNIIVSKTGTGTLTLSGSNSYNGGTTIKAGTIVTSSSNAVGTISVLVGDTTGSSNASLLNAGFTVGNAIRAQTGNSGVITLGGNAANSSTFSGAITLGSTGGVAAKDATFVAAAGGTAIFSGQIDEESGATTVANVTIGGGANTGMVVFSNTANLYAGVTTINGGVLSVSKLADGGNSSSIGNSGSGGAGGSAASDLVINGGVLQYTGVGHSTNRLFTIGVNGATIDASGASNAAVNFTGTGSLVAAGTGDRALTLTGASTGTNTLTSVIADPSSGKTAVTKTGAGTWKLQGANTYTGVTTISAGTLLLTTNGTSNIASSSAIDFTSSGSGTLNVSGVAGGFRVVTGQTIKGTGTVIGNTTIMGNLAPGNSSGLLTFNDNLTLSGTATMEIFSQTTRGSTYDAVNIGSTLAYGGVLTLDLTGAGGFSSGTVFDLFSAGSVTGDLASINIVGASSPYFGLTFTLAGSGASGLWTSSLNGGGQYLTFSQGSGDLTIAGVPEPKVAVLVGVGLAAIWIRVRQRRIGRI